MKNRLLLTGAVTLSIISSFLFGYLVAWFERVDVEKPSIRIIPDVNERVPTVDFEKVGGGKVYGKVGEKYVRLRYKGEVVVSSKDGKFVIGE